MSSNYPSYPLGCFPPPAPDCVKVVRGLQGPQGIQGPQGFTGPK